MKSRALSILLVEDNAEIAGQLVDYLEEKDLIMDYAATGREAVNLMDNNSFDLIILDLMLPDTDGYELCNTLKQKSEKYLPVLMLTARDSLHDKLHGFEVGADDYLTKPFALEEVYMRCLALSRREQLHQEKAITLGELTIDSGQKSVSRQGKMLSLSKTDFTILQALVAAYPNAVSKRELNQKVWGNDMPETDALRSHIYTLRNTIDKPFAQDMIKTVHGIGFKLVI